MRAHALRPIATVCTALSLVACATLPAGPSLQSLPGSQRTQDQFAADDARCRAFASDYLAGRMPTAAESQNVAAGAVTGTAIGAVTGAAIDGSAGAAAGAGLGLVLGALAGSTSAQAAWDGTQQQFDRAYYACMYSLGHKVPVPADDVARDRTWFENAAPRPGIPPPD
ncbi:MAG TPA: hypothetical protein VLM87_01630 [Rubrivivax sp.]|nr:hypothetical protein [Rubrivivax sp.]